MARKIDLNELLYGAPSWTDVVSYFKTGDFPEEHYLVAAIKKHLLTAEQEQALFACKFSIEDMLNGRVEGDKNRETVSRLFNDWNTKLGHAHFGF